jgi:hypothetical protein
MAVHLDHLMAPPRNYRHFLPGLREQVRRHYRDGLSDFEMKPRIAQALDAYRHWSGRDENLGPLISAAYIEIETEEFELSQLERNGRRQMGSSGLGLVVLQLAEKQQASTFFHSAHPAPSSMPYCFSLFQSVVRDIPSRLAVAARFPPVS